MKRILIAIALMTVTSAGAARAEETASADALVWCGLDYSKVKMIGSEDFHEPESIFPEMLEKWNSLFMKEMLPNLEKMASPLRSDVTAVEGPNSKAKASQIVHEDGTKDEMVTPTDITEKDIATAVKNYKIKYKDGMGLVFIMDRLVRAQETGCLYVVFFDIASRKVVYSERICAKSGGIGFRNYWFSPIKEVVKKLPKIYKDVKAKK